MVDGYEWVFVICALGFVVAGLGYLNAAYILITERRERGAASRTLSKPRRRSADS
jgi:hypothetical protein